MFNVPSPMYMGNQGAPQMQRSSGGQILQAPVINPMGGGGAQQPGQQNPMAALQGAGMQKLMAMLGPKSSAPNSPGGNPLASPTTPTGPDGVTPAATIPGAMPQIQPPSSAPMQMPWQTAPGQAAGPQLPWQQAGAGTAGAGGTFPSWLTSMFGG